MYKGVIGMDKEQEPIDLTKIYDYDEFPDKSQADVITAGV